MKRIVTRIVTASDAVNTRWISLIPYVLSLKKILCDLARPSVLRFRFGLRRRTVMRPSLFRIEADYFILIYQIFAKFFGSIFQTFKLSIHEEAAGATIVGDLFGIEDWQQPRVFGFRQGR